MSQFATTEASPEEPFFQHRPPMPPPTGELVVNEATRLMCAGAYLDPSYARAVVAELVEDEARAVVPSTGYDVNPVLRHCFHASRLDMRRDLLLTAVLAVGALVTPVAVFIWIGLGVVLAIATSIKGRRPWWTVPAVIVAVLVVCGLVGPLATMLAPFIPALGVVSGGYGGYGGYGSAPSAPSGVDSSWLVVALVVVAFLIELSHRHQVYRILTTSLASGSAHKPPAMPMGRVGRRVAAASAAQWGNLTLHADRNPFLGAGVPVQTWSMCLELKSRSRPGTRVHLDAVDMHTAVRARLTAMRQSPLPENERVTGLAISDHLVARGLRRRNDRVIDQRSHTPFAQMSQEAIEAVIRHPQGSLRYYQRVVVGSDGKAIVMPDQRVLASAQDQEVAVSTFLHLAVEGGLLYAEFVATVMPSVRASFREFDLIAPDDVTGRAIGVSLLRFVPGVALAPFRLVSGLFRGGVARRMDKAARVSRRAYVYDFGARQSIRWLAAAQDLGDYLQRLDGEKYYKLVERTMTAAMLDYLRAHDVDTAEYEERITEVHNHGLIINGGEVSGPIAFGPNAKASKA